jgi:hypothetical protein
VVTSPREVGDHYAHIELTSLHTEAESHLRHPLSHINREAELGTLTTPCAEYSLYLPQKLDRCRATRRNASPERYA